MANIVTVIRDPLTTKGWQWNNQPPKEVPDWLTKLVVCVSPFNGTLWVNINNLLTPVKTGDWLIHQTGGVVFVITADVFEQEWRVATIPTTKEETSTHE